MADRIVRRVGEKKDDFKVFIEALPKVSLSYSKCSGFNSFFRKRNNNTWIV